MDATGGDNSSVDLLQIFKSHLELPTPRNTLRCGRLVSGGASRCLSSWEHRRGCARGHTGSRILHVSWLVPERGMLVCAPTAQEFGAGLP